MALAEGAEAAEATAEHERRHETALENGEVHTVRSDEETVFGLRVLVGGSLGFTTANQTGADSLARAAAEAVAQARVTPTDPNNGLPLPRTVTPVESLVDEKLENMNAEESTALAVSLLERVRARDPRVRVDSGSVFGVASARAIASSQGMDLAESSVEAGGYLFGMAVDGDKVASSDYDGDATRRRESLETVLEGAADRFVDKCVSGLDAGKGSSFKGSILLSHDAVAEFLLPNLAPALGADWVRKGQSLLAGKIGEAIASELLTLSDDGTVAGGVASASFDREGLPVERRVLIEKGVLAAYLYDDYEARAAGIENSSGHARGSAGSLPSLGPWRLELAPGSASEEDLEGGSGPLVIVNRFSGSTNPVTGDFSGVVKNGFLVEAGRSRPVQELMIAGNLFEMLHDISAVGAERRLVGTRCLVPALRAENISVTAG